jgi:hypothetical protein
MRTAYPTFGLSEQELREAFERELLQAMRSEGDAPTIHAIAHTFARVVELDHLRITEQLSASGVRPDGHAERDLPEAG